MHDFAYSDTYFDGYEPPSVLQVPAAKEVAVELYTLTKSFSMAGWRVAFCVGNAEVVGALAKLKSYLDYGTFQPIQIASIVALNEAPDYPKTVNAIYESRRDSLVDGLNRIGWTVKKPLGTMFVWAPVPEPYQEMGSLEFAKYLVTEANVATSPGVGFGAGGEGLRPLRSGGKRTAHRPGRPQPAPRRSPSWVKATPSINRRGAPNETSRSRCGPILGSCPLMWSVSGCRTGPERWARWPAGSAPYAETWSAWTSWSGGPAGPSMS